MRSGSPGKVTDGGRGRLHEIGLVLHRYMVASAISCIDSAVESKWPRVAVVVVVQARLESPTEVAKVSIGTVRQLRISEPSMKSITGTPAGNWSLSWRPHQLVVGQSNQAGLVKPGFYAHGKVGR